MSNRKGKIGRFIPYKKEGPNVDIEKEKVRLDIEIIRSLRYKFKDNKELSDLFSKVIKLLLNNVRK